ncbi:molybdenum cofactor guanylyltransferase [soil metagenome]
MTTLGLEIEGFILAGGVSTRMGKEKAHLNLAGKTFLMRAASALRAVAPDVSLIGGNSDTDLGLPVLPDVYASEAIEKRASVIGLHAALVYSKAAWTAVLACDLPFVTGELMKRLVELGNTERGVSGAVIPVQPDGMIQPFCALYNTHVCLPLVERMLAEGSRRAQEIVGRLPARYVKFSEVSDLADAEKFFFNVNTPQDLRMAVELERR